MKNTKVQFLLKIYLILLMVVGINSFFLVQTTKAGTFWDKQVGMGTDSGEVGNAFGETSGRNGVRDIRLTIANIINVFLGFLGIIFLIIIIYAGFNWMTANGQEEKVGKAKTMLVAGIIGFIIIASSFAISVMITDKIFTATVNTPTATP